MASRLFWRHMPSRWLFRRNRTHMTTTNVKFRCKRTRRVTDFPLLPNEIIEQILLKLHCIKSIVTCTSVCKSWYVLIKSREFITMHLSRPISNAEYFLCYYDRQFYYSIEYYDKGRLRNHYDLSFPGEKRVTVHGSCNGLICYTDDVSSDIYLWNPSIRKLKILPKSIYYAKHTAYKFWYDTISDDYKVAKISCTKISKVEVYSLSSNSWDEIITSRIKYPKTYFDDGVHVNGTLYWLTFESKNWRLVSLNLITGMFRDTPIWSAVKSEPRFVINTLRAHGGSLCVLRDSYEGMDIHVYDETLNELHKYELEKSEKMNLRPLCVRNNSDEVLLQRLDTNQPILVFNIGELKFKGFCLSAKTINQVIPFVETLALLDDEDSSSTPILERDCGPQ